MGKQTSQLKQKTLFRDEQGAELAYSYDGTVHAIGDGRRFATLKGGNVYGVARQLFGWLTLKGVVRGQDGIISEAFMRLVAG